MTKDPAKIAFTTSRTASRSSRVRCWFENVGYIANFAQLKRDFSKLSDFESYLRNHNWTKANRIQCRDESGSDLKEINKRNK